ncbi:MAG TPA: hypothetical protein VNN72_21260 [Polyangiaceae bacterium]|nr:hypothetical protein [Polyangiaceae bacterium]
MQAEVDPASAFAAVVKVAGERQYNVLERRDPDRYLRLRSHVDENKSDHASYITIQVDAAGRVTITPSGSLVKNNKVHPRLSSEITYFEDALKGELKRGAASAPATASALPPPPPPPPVETASAPPPPPAPSPATPAKPAPKSAATGKDKAPAAPKAKPAGGDDWEPVK